MSKGGQRGGRMGRVGLGLSRKTYNTHAGVHLCDTITTSVGPMMYGIILV